jgi:hypothetical protein
MANVREMRIFSADQIVVPPELPNILKEYSKEVIRENPADLVAFSKEYFEMKVAEQKEAAAATKAAAEPAK